MVASLDKAGIGYRIDNNTGTLTVNADDLYKARMLVASDGALATPDPTASLDNLPLGASRTLEGERLRTAREKNFSLLRRQGAARVEAEGARGAAQPANEKRGEKVEVFDEALERVGSRLDALDALE